MHPYLHIDVPLSRRFRRSCKHCIDFGITSKRILPFRTHTFTRSWTCIQNFVVASVLLATILYPVAAKALFLSFSVGGLLADILTGFFSNVKALGLFGYFVYSLAFVYGCCTITV